MNLLRQVLWRDIDSPYVFVKLLLDSSIKGALVDKTEDNKKNQDISSPHTHYCMDATIITEASALC